jgi:uncharacterized protein
MSDRGAFVVPVHDLDLEGRSVRFPIAPAWLRGALEGCELQPAGPTGHMDVHLTKTGNDVLVQGQVDATLVVPCARCLEPVQFRPHIELSLLLHPASAAATSARRAGEGRVGEGRPVGQGKPAGEGKSAGEGKPLPKGDDEAEFGGDEADTDTFQGEEVVLDRFVREAILLESPIFPLCSEACEGIRPASASAPASQGAVTDPRLLPLLELAKRRKMKE